MKQAGRLCVAVSWVGLVFALGCSESGEPGGLAQDPEPTPLLMDTDDGEPDVPAPDPESDVGEEDVPVVEDVPDPEPVPEPDAELMDVTEEEPEDEAPPSPVDSDGDGVPDDEDAFPFDPGESVDTDGDGIGDNRDLFPDDPGEAFDLDMDGIGDNADEDDDGDGVSDEEELSFGEDCVRSSPVTPDSDDDGILDGADPYPMDPFPEFLLRANDAGSIDLFLSNRDGTFEDPVQIGEPIEHNGAPLTYGQFSIGDFNNDGRMDFVAHSSPLVEGGTTRQFYFFYRDEKADEFNQIYIGDTEERVSGILTDANADGAFDIVTFRLSRDGYISRGQFQTYLGNYDGDSTCVWGDAPEDDCFFVRLPHLEVTDVVGGQWQARIGRQAVDLNPLDDDFPDLTLVTYASGGNAATTVYTLYGNGDGSFGAPVQRFVHNQDRSQAPANTVMFADFNNDDVGDIIMGFDDDGSPGEAWTYFGDGEGGFLPGATAAVDINPNDAREQNNREFLGREGSGRTFDFDFDGNMDLIIGVHHTNYADPHQTRLYRGLGDGTFDPTFTVIGPVSRFASAFELPQRLCPTFEFWGE